MVKPEKDEKNSKQAKSETQRALELIKKQAIPLKKDESMKGKIIQITDFKKDVTKRNSQTGQLYELKDVPHLKISIKDENGYTYEVRFPVAGKTNSNFTKYLMLLDKEGKDITSVITEISNTNDFAGRTFKLIG